MSVTLNNYGKMANMNTAEFYGKSTDEKPTEQNGGNIINGSIYVEIDTGRAYFYDAEMKMWTPVTPPSADGTYTKEQIDALLNKKMSYYIVTVDGNKIVHEGETLTYAKIQQLYEDESVFIYMEHAGLTLIPSVDVDNSIIAFSSDWMRKEGTGYEPFIYVVQITSDNTVTSQQFQIEDVANKVTVINGRNATSEEKYPSVKAVVDYVDKDSINAEITDIKEDLTLFMTGENTVTPKWTNYTIGNDGKPSAYRTDRLCSERIEIFYGTTLTIFRSTTGISPNVYLFDETDTLIGSAHYLEYNTPMVISYEEAKYVRVGVQYNDSRQISPDEGNTLIDIVAKYSRITDLENNIATVENNLIEATSKINSDILDLTNDTTDLKLAVFGNIDIKPEWINYTTGNDGKPSAYDTRRLVTQPIEIPEGGGLTAYRSTGGITIYVRTFDDSDTLIESKWLDINTNLKVKDCRYVRVTFQFNDNRDVAPAVGNQLVSLSLITERSSDDTKYKLANVLANKINRNMSECRESKRILDETFKNMLPISLNDGVTRTATIPAVGTHDAYLVRVGLHYGESKYTPSSNELFFDGNCKKDFSDVRFFDSNGNILEAYLGTLVNMELYEDNNLNYLKKITSQGYIIGFRVGHGLVISKNNGRTYSDIPNTANVTTHGSAMYGYKDMFPVFVDSNDNIYAYAGGKLYKLYANDDYATIKEVLDYSWTAEGGTIIYPDVQIRAMDADSNGVLFVGACYQEQYHTNIYRSTDGGESFQLCWHNYFGEYQHVHHIHADPYSNKVYFGIDDGGAFYGGSKILVTEDGGNTFSELPSNKDYKGRDYYPTYFGDGTYKLGSGETYYMGDATIYRSEDDVNFTKPLDGIAGIRSFADFGDDSIILAGTQLSNGNSNNTIIMSTDKGETWTKIYTKWQEPRITSGIGFRNNYNAVQLNEDTEPCIIMHKDTGDVRNMRIYKGGDKYYREAFILVKNTTDSDITITAKTGFMISYPTQLETEQKHDGVIFHLPLNEGCGKFVTDSNGTTYTINGADYSWDTKEPVRIGDINENNYKPIIPSSALKLDRGTFINIGKIDKANFTTGFTITAWVNPCGRLNKSEEEWNSYKNRNLVLFTIGNIKFYNRYFKFGYGDDVREASLNGNYNQMPTTVVGYPRSNQYYFVTITVDNQNNIVAYINGTPNNYVEKSNVLPTIPNFSENDLIIGSESLESVGYISDFKIYNRALSADEILCIYRGI